MGLHVYTVLCYFLYHFQPEYKCVDLWLVMLTVIEDSYPRIADTMYLSVKGPIPTCH